MEYFYGSLMLLCLAGVIALDMFATQETLDDSSIDKYDIDGGF